MAVRRYKGVVRRNGSVRLHRVYASIMAVKVVPIVCAVFSLAESMSWDPVFPDRVATLVEQSDPIVYCLVFG